MVKGSYITGTFLVIEYDPTEEFQEFKICEWPVLIQFEMIGLYRSVRPARSGASAATRQVARTGHGAEVSQPSPSALPQLISAYRALHSNAHGPGALRDTTKKRGRPKPPSNS